HFALNCHRAAVPGDAGARRRLPRAPASPAAALGRHSHPMVMATGEADNLLARSAVWFSSVSLPSPEPLSEYLRALLSTKRLEPESAEALDLINFVRQCALEQHQHRMHKRLKRNDTAQYHTVGRH